MNKKIGFIIGGIGLAIGGYAYYLKKQYEKLKGLQYRVQNIQFDNIGLTNARINADVVINNPTEVKYTVNSYNIDIIFKGTKLANVKKSGINTTLLPNGVATLPITVQLDPLSVGENLLSVFLSSLSVNQTQQNKGIAFVGKISGRFGLFGFKNIEIKIGRAHV